MPSLASLLFPFCLFLLHSVRRADALTVSYDFNITWVRANPDGALARPAVGVNGHWPPPRIEANLGDTVVVNVLNLLGNQSTTLHFHGIFMNGTTHMDGPAQVSQCPILPGSSFTYTFKVPTVVARGEEHWLNTKHRQSRWEPIGIIPM
jgi:iron transport multicopper oxidase